MSLHAGGVVGYGAGFGERGLLERDRIREVVEAARRRLHKFRHGAVHAVAESQALGAKVVLSGPAVKTLAADARRGLRSDAISFPEATDRFAHAGNDAAKLVSQDHRHVDRPTVRVVVLMDLAATNAHGPGPKQDLIVREVAGPGQLAQLNRT